MTVNIATNLATLEDHAEVKATLAKFGVIHCTGCSLPDKTVSQVAAELNLPADVILNAINAELA
ncbi:hypothetical protein OAU50_05310 [Planctomycetota bacterium]|nr:hypothetical protein [Planctomycetota bacterium]